MTVGDTNLVASMYIKRELKPHPKTVCLYLFFYLIPFLWKIFEGHLFLGIKQHF